MIGATLKNSFGHPFGGPFSTGLMDNRPSLKFISASPDPQGIMQLQVMGKGEATSTHDATIYADDWEDIYRGALSDEQIWEGGRAVENLIPSPEDFTDSSWSKGGTATASEPNTINLPSSGDTIHHRFVTSTVAGESFIFSVELSGTPGQTVTIRIRDNFDNLEISDLRVTLTTESLTHTVNLTTSVDHPNGLRTYIYRAPSDTAIQVLANYAQVEPATGRSDSITPSEYVGTTKRVFNYENDNSVDANGIVTRAKGALLAPQPNLVYNPAVSNEILYSRDLTNWTFRPGTSVVATYDQVGIDGKPNTATKLSNIGAVAVDDVRINVSGLTANASQGIAIWMKTITTSGNLTIRNAIGVPSGNWTIDLSKVSSTKYDKLTYDHEAVTEQQPWVADATGNGGVIMYMSTGSSDFIIGNVNNLDNTSKVDARGIGPIFTEASAIAIDECKAAFDISNHSDKSSCLFFEWSPSFSSSEKNGNIPIVSLNGGSDLLYYDATNNQLKSTDGANTASKSLAITHGTTYKIALVWHDSEGKFAIAVDGVLGADTAFDGAFAVGASIEVLQTGRNLQRWQGGTYAQLKAKALEITT